MGLNETCIKYGTDKSSNFHNYSDKYKSYFSSIKNDELKILSMTISTKKRL
jgi:hypothetical protein